MIYQTLKTGAKLETTCARPLICKVKLLLGRLRFVINARHSEAVISNNTCAKRPDIEHSSYDAASCLPRKVFK